MKENDIVTLINLKKEYENKYLYLHTNGVVLKILPKGKARVLFLNDKIVGDYAVLEVEETDLKKEDLVLPINFVKELKTSNKISEENISKKENFEKSIFKENDLVELIIEDEKYTKYGLHTGERGVVCINYSIKNTVLVDFSGFNENGKFYDGDCVSVNIKDLKLIK